MEFEFYTLANGIRLIHQPVKGAVAHLGVIINAGSRDEDEMEHGMAHLVEHVIFKGTQKRKAYHVISRLEDVGGELDAYTTKEETCIYASFMQEYYERAFELFADIVFHSTYPEKELEKEKEVILDEINSYKDSPAELIFDDFEEQVFAGHPIGRNILGSPEALRQHSRDALLAFVDAHYHTSQMVLSSVGDIPFKTLVKWAEKYFGQVETREQAKRRQVLNGYHPGKVVLQKDTYQSHCILGNRAPAIADPKRLPLELLINMLGGPGMNSRLNMALREKHGYTYNIEAFYTPYSDTGILGIYFGTDKEKVARCMQIIQKELKRLMDSELGVLQLHRAQKQLIGQMAISAENRSNLMLNVGRSYLLFDQVDSLQKVFQKIEKIQARELRDVAREYFDWEQLSQLIYE